MKSNKRFFSLGLLVVSLLVAVNSIPKVDEDMTDLVLSAVQPVIPIAEAGGAGGGGGSGGSSGGSTSGGKGGGGGGGTSGGKGGGGSGTSGGKGGGSGPTVNDPTWGSINVVSTPPPGYSYYDTRTINGTRYDTYYDSSVGRAGGPTAGSPVGGSGGGGGNGGGLPSTITSRPPDVTLRVAVNGGSLQAGSVTVAVTDTLSLYWNVVSFGNNLNCSGQSAFSSLYPGAPNGNLGIATPAPNSSQTYRLNCTDSNGSDSDTVVVATPAPTAVDLRARVNGTAAWLNTSPFIISNGQQVELNWQNNGGTATSCSTSGGGFNNSGVPGTDTDVIEPALGTSLSFQARCSGQGGNSADTIDVYNPALDPTIVASLKLVDIGDPVSLTWNTLGNDPTACRLTGPSLNRALTASEGTGTLPNVTVNGESNFSIVCAPNGINPGGTGTDKVMVTAKQTES